MKAQLVFISSYLMNIGWPLVPLFYSKYVSAFQTRGVPGPTSELSPRAPAQMGRRETERAGTQLFFFVVAGACQDG